MLLLNKAEKTCLLIDGANISATAKALRMEMDWKAVLDFFKEYTNVYGALYYTAVYEDAEGHVGIRTLMDWLDYNGYRVVSKPAKEYTNDISGKRRIKGNMDIELTVDALKLSNHVDHIVLFSGDGDFRYLLQAVQEKAVRVSVISSINTNPPMISDALRRQADTFVDLADFRELFSRHR